MTTRKTTPRRSNTPRRLRAETLETRRVMAAAVDLSADGLLVIEGTAENNRIWVSQSRSGERLRVSIDGRTADFPAANISLMKIFAGAGNDAVRVSRRVEIPTQIFGGDGNDRLAAGSGPTLIEGGDGRDRIRGGAGVNVLFGGAGNDRIVGGASVDYIIGGAGNDILRGGGGDDWIFGDATNSLPEGETDPLEYARANSDVNRGNDIIHGGRGNDMVFAGHGNDRIRGGVGNDFLHGGGGNDRIRGDRGRDELVGGAGSDDLRGGLGADVIRARDGEVDVIFADRLDELFVDDIDRIVRRDRGDSTESGDLTTASV
ncbi:calcium-binding protein [Stieleria maiorica]|uniref:calcium-binding protein n=1 Tax=Stieleria maiorica TaxID=2795974 RepID=UPI00142F292F|nr:calcium-binding protein [Stieleria maiorica]